MGKRTGRPRGAPEGNTNRLKHGRYSAAHRAELAEVSALIRDSRNLVRRALMFLRMRKALQEKRKRSTSTFVVIPGELRAQRARCEGREPNFLLFPLRKSWVPFPRRVPAHAPRRG